MQGAGLFARATGEAARRVACVCVPMGEGPARSATRRHRAFERDTSARGVDVFALRSKLGMTQRVFGAQFGVSRHQVQKWESGAAWPRRRQLEKLVKLSEVATSAFAEITDS